MMIILAIVLGLAFGFVLQRAGAADPDKIIGMLRLKDFHLAKAILLAVGLSSALLFLGLLIGIINPGHLSIKSSYTGVALGGLILGLGWAIAGYCPGTGLVALGAGRRDAISFVLGGLVGAGLFTFIYGSIQNTWIFTEWLGGKVALSSPDGSYSWVFVLAIVFVMLSHLLPEPTSTKNQ